jgi:hypothetical protein
MRFRYAEYRRVLGPRKREGRLDLTKLHYLTIITVAPSGGGGGG